MIDMRDLTPVGEFGSREWCEACASYGAKILETGNMPPALGLQRGLHLPTERLISPEWPQSGYYFMVANGTVSSGADIPDECLATPGFHASIRWAFVCNQSRTLYGSAGQKQRGIDEAELTRQMAEYLGFEPDLGYIRGRLAGTSCIGPDSGCRGGCGFAQYCSNAAEPVSRVRRFADDGTGCPRFF